LNIDSPIAISYSLGADEAAAQSARVKVFIGRPEKRKQVEREKKRERQEKEVEKSEF
jgi:hypothetical protein